jgi:LysM repeat protein
MAFRGVSQETHVMRARMVLQTGSRRLFCSLLFLLLFVFTPLALAGDYLLYLPNQVDVRQPLIPGEGVIVKKIIIKRGDTLAALSRHFSGKAAYYPQILLFNKIRNPNLIYVGNELLVPLSKNIALHKRVLSPPSTPIPVNGIPVTNPKLSTVTENRRGSPVPSAERQFYEQAVTLFTQAQYRKALEGFTFFLETYPDSSLVPDARLYRGDCFLRLSAN